jgi:demethylmenaquinone methyltransferase/2-methoxy-6-polyprenyl-1,4-benzoquinol methylase
LTNLLTPGGNPIGNPLFGIPPGSPLARLQNAYFVGPSLPGKPLSACQLYQQRQQVGQFLYMIDRSRREVVVINSNRMTVLERIQLPDPTELALGPNLDYLAVSNINADVVSFIDINPISSNFHSIVKTTKVGRGPRGIAWDPGNEDILVCNEIENSVSIISAFDFQVRKVVTSSLFQPFDLCITQRQQGFGFLRNCYFGWILNRNGQLAMFESGPNGVNGWGYDDIIGVMPFVFNKPKRIAVDFGNLGGSVWVLHENKLNGDGTNSNVPGGAVTNVFIESAIFGPIPLNVNSFAIPQFRDMAFAVALSVGPEQITGIPVDMALRRPRQPRCDAEQLPAAGRGLPDPAQRQVVRARDRWRSRGDEDAQLPVPGRAELDPRHGRGGRAQRLRRHSPGHERVHPGRAIDPGRRRVVPVRLLAPITGAPRPSTRRSPGWTRRAPLLFARAMCYPRAPVPDPREVRSMFARIAGRYDLVNRVLSLGIDRRWRAAALRLSGDVRGRVVVDACCGTGDLSLAYARAGARVVGVDFTPEMLRLALPKGERAASGALFAQGDALRLPVRARGADVASVAFGVRNLADPHAGLAELARVVKPGGRVIVLEFATPRPTLFAALYRAYFTRVLPRIGGAISGDREAYRYLPRTVLAWPGPEEFQRWFERAGLVDCGHRLLSGGIACLHWGRVPDAPARRG